MSPPTAHRFGDRSAFAVEVGAMEPSELRVVDVWAAGKRLTTADNVAYAPFLSRAMRSTAIQVRRGEVTPCPFPDHTPEEIFRLLHTDETEFREQFWFMPFGEIIDNVSRYAYLDDELVIAFAFWRPDHPVPEDLGKVFVARLRPDEFATTLADAAELLTPESLR